MTTRADRSKGVTEGGSGSASTVRVMILLLWIAFALVAIGVVIAGVFIGIYNSKTVKTINGVPPTNGNIAAVAGQGLTITPSPLTSTIEFVNNGVLSVNGLSPTALGALTLAATAPGLSVTNLLNTITLANTGVTSLLAGDGISVDAATGAVTVSNTGVITVNSLTPSGAGDIVIAVSGAGLSVLSAGNTVTLENTGVTAVTAGTGMTVNSTTGNVLVSNDGVLSFNGNSNIGAWTFNDGDGTGAVVTGLGTITYNHLMTSYAALSTADASSSDVEFLIAIGFSTPIPDSGIWRTGLVPTGGAPAAFFPGAFGSGQGSPTPTSWVVPAGVAVWQIDVDCDISLPTLVANDRQVLFFALSLGATTEDPSSGLLLPGARTTIDLSGGTTSTTAPTNTYVASMSSGFRTNCPGCSYVTGQSLSVHAAYEETGVGGPTTTSVTCRMRTARTI